MPRIGHSSGGSCRQPSDPGGGPGRAGRNRPGKPAADVSASSSGCPGGSGQPRRPAVLGRRQGKRRFYHADLPAAADRAGIPPRASQETPPADHGDIAGVGRLFHRRRVVGLGAVRAPHAVGKSAANRPICRAGRRHVGLGKGRAGARQICPGRRTGKIASFISTYKGTTENAQDNDRNAGRSARSAYRGHRGPRAVKPGPAPDGPAHVPPAAPTEIAKIEPKLPLPHVKTPAAAPDSKKPPTPAAVPDKPVPEEPELAKPPERVGHLVSSDDQVLLAYNTKAGYWERVAAKESLVSQQRLLVPPTYRDEISIGVGVTVDLLGGTQVQLLPARTRSRSAWPSTSDAWCWCRRRKH